MSAAACLMNEPVALNFHPESSGMPPINRGNAKGPTARAFPPATPQRPSKAVLRPHAAGEGDFATPGARNASGHAKTGRKKKTASTLRPSRQQFGRRRFDNDESDRGEEQGAQQATQHTTRSRRPTPRGAEEKKVK